MIICNPFGNLLFAELLHLFAGLNQVEERRWHGRLLLQWQPWQALDRDQLKDQEGLELIFDLFGGVRFVSALARGRA